MRHIIIVFCGLCALPFSLSTSGSEEVRERIRRSPQTVQVSSQSGPQNRGNFFKARFALRSDVPEENNSPDAESSSDMKTNAISYDKPTFLSLRALSQPKGSLVGFGKQKSGPVSRTTSTTQAPERIFPDDKNDYGTEPADAGQDSNVPYIQQVPAPTFPTQAPVESKNVGFVPSNVDNSDSPYIEQVTPPSLTTTALPKTPALDAYNWQSASQHVPAAPEDSMVDTLENPPPTQPPHRERPQANAAVLFGGFQLPQNGQQPDVYTADPTEILQNPGQKAGMLQFIPSFNQRNIPLEIQQQPNPAWRPDAQARSQPTVAASARQDFVVQDQNQQMNGFGQPGQDPAQMNPFGQQGQGAGFQQPNPFDQQGQGQGQGQQDINQISDPFQRPGQNPLFLQQQLQQNPSQQFPQFQGASLSPQLATGGDPSLNPVSQAAPGGDQFTRQQVPQFPFQQNAQHDIFQQVPLPENPGQFDQFSQPGQGQLAPQSAAFGQQDQFQQGQPSVQDPAAAGFSGNNPFGQPGQSFQPQPQFSGINGGQFIDQSNQFSQAAGSQAGVNPNAGTDGMFIPSGPQQGQGPNQDNSAQNPVNFQSPEQPNAIPAASEQSSEIVTPGPEDTTTVQADSTLPSEGPQPDDQTTSTEAPHEKEAEMRAFLDPVGAPGPEARSANFLDPLSGGAERQQGAFLDPMSGSGPSRGRQPGPMARDAYGASMQPGYGVGGGAPSGYSGGQTNYIQGAAGYAGGGGGGGGYGGGGGGYGGGGAGRRYSPFLGGIGGGSGFGYPSGGSPYPYGAYGGFGYGYRPYYLGYNYDLAPYGIPQPQDFVLYGKNTLHPEKGYYLRSHDSAYSSAGSTAGK